MPARWRIISRYPAYEISASGIIRRRLPGQNTWPGRRLTPSASNGGYLYVCFTNQREFIHQLVCEVWHGPPPSPLHQAAHNNGKNQDNRQKNLAWKTGRENYDDRIRHGKLRGSRNHAAKLGESDVRRIRKLGRRMGGRAIAAKYPHVTEQAISLILLKKTWRHVK